MKKDIVFKSGKYYNRKVTQVPKSYLKWYINNIDPIEDQMLYDYVVGYYYSVKQPKNNTYNPNSYTSLRRYNQGHR